MSKDMAKDLDVITIREGASNLYDAMLAKYISENMVKYITDEHKTDFVAGCVRSIDLIKKERITQSNLKEEEILITGPQSSKHTDFFYDTISDNVQFLFWNGDSDPYSLDIIISEYQDFVKSHLDKWSR